VTLWTGEALGREEEEKKGKVAEKRERERERSEGGKSGCCIQIAVVGCYSLSYIHFAIFPFWSLHFCCFSIYLQTTSVSLHF
ncbi:unnamed protein product, partial [Linum tenue]